MSLGGEGVFFLGELGPFLKQNSLLLVEVVFFTRVLILLHGKFVWHLIFFCSRKLFPKDN
jgi:hypothetical protein